MKHSLLFCAAAALAILWGAGSATAQSTGIAGDWVEKTLPTIFNFDGQNYADRKKQNRALFTARGYKEFYKAMETSRLPDSLRMRNQNVQITKICTRSVREAQSTAAAALWRVEATVVFGYNNLRHTHYDTHNVTINVEEAPPQSGQLAIAQYIAVPARAADQKDCAAPASTRAPRVIRGTVDEADIEGRIRTLDAERAKLEQLLKDSNNPDLLIVP